MMIRILILLLAFFLCSTTIADEKLEFVGCWESTISELNDNVATLCLNRRIASISYYFTNKDAEAEPTFCYQHAFIESEGDSILLSGVGGSCENGRAQGEITFRCRPTQNRTMPCEMFFGYAEIEATQVERK